MGQVAPTCSLDPTFIASNKLGIYPDSAINFIQGMVGQPYFQNITVKVPKDTLSSSILFCFNRIELSSPVTAINFSLPIGLNLNAGPTVTNTAGIYKFRGNANSCSVISGTPTLAGTYTLQFKVQPYVTPGFGSCPITPNYNSGSALTPPSTLLYYIIKINPASTVGFKEDVNSKSINLSNLPNPFSGKTIVKFNVKDESVAKICVYNLLGDKVYEDKLKTTFGENSILINASNWSNGIYIYNINYKNYTETKRMIVDN